MDLPTQHLAEKQSEGKLAAEKKWGHALDAGFQLLPNVLLLEMRTLKLQPLDVLIILNITLHWWEASSLPYPKPLSIAERLGVSTRTIERRLQALEKRGFIRRLPVESSRWGRSVRRIDMSGFVQELAKLAPETLNKRSSARTSGPDTMSGL